MGLPRTDMKLAEYLRVNDAWHGVDRTEGGVGLKIPVVTEKVMQKRMVEAQLVLNIAYDVINFCRRTHRGERRIKDVENLEVDQITAENPSNAGVRLIDAGAATKDPYYIKVFMNKTFGINQINVTWGMCSDEMLLVHYMNDFKARFGNGANAPESVKKVEIQADI